MKHTDRNYLLQHFKAIHHTSPVEWKISDSLVEYPEALRYMQERVENISAKT
ncbi:MAG: lipoyl(octanoyl) transferase LipB, partial [Bartonella sp.]|nr:lipoyl(octanoyl) transferase LipB [Bartonella sp.]